jgi:hypothetical protein
MLERPCMIARRALHYLAIFCLSWPGAAALLALWGLFLWLI